MAERKGPEGEPSGHDPGGSGQQDDRSSGADEREPVSADEGTELSDNDRESGSTESEPTRPSTSGDDDAAVLPFRHSGDERDSGGEGDPADEDDLDDVDLDDVEDPVDLAALQADDELLDALGGPNPVLPEAPGTGPSVDELLVAWRQDVDAAPIEDLVDIDTAAATIAQARRPRRKHLKRWHLVPVASAAAVLMITGTGFGLAARDAQPGDMLWGVAQVLYSDHTRAVQAATVAREELDNAEGALVDGDRSSAEAALRSAQQEIQDVDQDHGLRELRAAHSSLTARMGQSGQEQETTSETTSETEVVPPTGTQEPAPTEPPRPTEPTDSSTAPPTSSETSESTTSPSETSGSSQEHPSEGLDSELFPSSGEHR
ncbi:hypothetical protein IQ251_11470 [Saccharopolyspora sp. HNM0983]|uniref:Anti-sigma-D factor RsdA sigma factor binding region domain-containing protein n=1 Tax=Saccharopolyspora montiporae TaxID=2781240 RepID=A0A929BA93_9PSEU|nr:anti-sigma-D factor RsdA [Saccharopolyspora sp. HNM0983]MBE9375060.1 hypothetical protein [Saccharopolyspora sp. HNM0983]